MSENENADIENANVDAESEAVAVDYEAKYHDEINSSKKYRKRAQDAETRAEDLAARLAVAASGTSESEKNLREALTKSQRKADTYEDAYRAEAVQSPLMAALAAAGITNTADAAFLLLGRNPHIPAVELVDGRPVVKVVDRNGDEVLDAVTGEPMTVEGLVTAWAQTETAEHYLPASGDTGSGAARGVTVPCGVTIAELDKHPEKMKAFIENYGQGAYLKLAARARKGNTKD